MSSERYVWLANCTCAIWTILSHKYEIHSDNVTGCANFGEEIKKSPFLDE